MGVRPRDTVPKPHVEKFSIGPTDSIINRDKPFSAGWIFLPYKPIYNVSSTASREFLRKPRDSPNVFGNACNGVANAGKFFMRLATVLQTPKSFSGHLQRCCKRQKVFRETCNSVANTKKFFEALAASLQTPKSFSRHLQHSCKRQKVFRGTCSIPANTRKFFATLAASLQTPKSFSKHLQHSCKLQKVFRGSCSVPANAGKFFAALAALLQTSRQTPRVQRNSRKGLCLRFDNTEDVSLMLLRLTFARPSKGDLHLII